MCACGADALCLTQAGTRSGDLPDAGVGWSGGGGGGGGVTAHPNNCSPNTPRCVLVRTRPPAAAAPAAQVQGGAGGSAAPDRRRLPRQSRWVRGPPSCDDSALGQVEGSAPPSGASWRRVGSCGRSARPRPCSDTSSPHPPADCRRASCLLQCGHACPWLSVRGGSSGGHLARGDNTHPRPIAQRPPPTSKAGWAAGPGRPSLGGSASSDDRTTPLILRTTQADLALTRVTPKYSIPRDFGGIIENCQWQ